MCQALTSCSHYGWMQGDTEENQLERQRFILCEGPGYLATDHTCR